MPLALLVASWWLGATGGRMSAWPCSWSAVAVALFLALLLG